ncbi:MAG: glycosyltransferase family 4 protein [Crocinitomicaceae bacterium]|jgi:L-malate glycosyltransferase|nr:glycosyltransferase family 4 protein [Crocinitomicaceae bacterium]
MKVLIVGSDSIHVSSFVSGLPLNIDCRFLTESPCGFDGVKEEIIVSFRSLNPLAIFRSNNRLGIVLSEMKPDVVHVHQINRLAYFVTRLCEKLDIPVVSTAWGSDVLVVPKKNIFFRYLVKKSLKRSKFVTADSQDMIDKMAALSASSEDKYLLLQYGIEMVSAGIKEDIIYSNRLHKPNYRIGQIIDYFNEMQENHPEWRLVIAGEGSDTSGLRLKIKRYNLEEKVDFVGWLSSTQNNMWYAKAKIYISIPISDGTSVSLLEAMSAGCLPVVPDIKVSHEWVEDGKNGVIEQVDVNPLMEALKLDQQICAEFNRDLIKEKASREHSMVAFQMIYKRAIDKG